MRMWSSFLADNIYLIILFEHEMHISTNKTEISFIICVHLTGTTRKQIMAPNVLFVVLLIASMLYEDDAAVSINPNPSTHPGTLGHFIVKLMPFIECLFYIFW